MKLLALFISTLCVLSTACCAADHPSWPSLASLLGQPISSTAVRNLVEAYQLREATKGEAGSFYSHDHGYSVMYRGYRVDCIVLKVSPWLRGEPHWIGYSGVLPFGLSVSDDRNRVVEKIGRPEHPKSNRWVFRGYRLSLIFDQGAKIEQAYIWKEEEAEKPNKSPEPTPPSVTPRASESVPK